MTYEQVSDMMKKFYNREFSQLKVETKLEGLKHASFMAAKYL